MFGFALKKAFFDLWDNLFFALAVNLVFTLGSLGTAVALTALGQAVGPASVFVLVPVPFLVAAVLGGLATFWGRDVVLKGRAQVGDFVPHLRSSWKASLVFGALWLMVAAGLLFGVPFYTAFNQLLGFGFGVVMAWLVFFGAGMSLFYPGLNAQVEPKIRKLFKKSFVLFLANPWPSLVMALGLVVSAVVTVVTLGFFPGVFGIAIWLQVCFKFILAKYEWIEANPDEDHKKVPWTVILADDMEKVGPRTLRSLIFPWKD